MQRGLQACFHCHPGTSAQQQRVRAGDYSALCCSHLTRIQAKQLPELIYPHAACYLQAAEGQSTALRPSNSKLDGDASSRARP